MAHLDRPRAHSITLSLPALSIIQLPSRLVESTIALSVVLAALNNIWPLVHERRWAVALGFGLIRGFGFASVLAIISAFLPLAHAGRRTSVYRRLVFVGGSRAIALVARVWLVERALDLKLGLI